MAAAWWNEVTQTVAQEFSDVPDAAQATRILLRLTIAALLGGLLGLEREAKGKEAGLRTHMLVSLGAALFVLVPQQAGVEPADLTRVLQGVIAGVGFLCAGTILKGSDEETVQGLTTAASVWMAAAIGVAAGLGREVTALLATGLALLILTLLPWTDHLFRPGTGGNAGPPTASKEQPQASKTAAAGRVEVRAALREAPGFRRHHPRTKTLLAGRLTPASMPRLFRINRIEPCG